MGQWCWHCYEVAASAHINSNSGSRNICDNLNGSNYAAAMLRS